MCESAVSMDRKINIILVPFHILYISAISPFDRTRHTHETPTRFRKTELKPQNVYMSIVIVKYLRILRCGNFNKIYTIESNIRMNKFYIF